MASSDWWRDATFYQVYVRSFADSDGDGVGDLDGVRERLGYLELLGVDALWLTPFFRSPMADGGYDVQDPRDVDPMFGDLAAFDRLVAEAHHIGIKITIDLVPNHTSDRHAWFQEALADPYGPARDRYVFRQGRGDGPPNNWICIPGGSAWTRVPDGAWYLHLFDERQPDLNWAHPDVWADFEHTLRFWLDRGVDGFRIDVAHGMAKPADLPDMDLRAGNRIGQHDLYDPRFDNDGVHDVHRLVRRVMDSYPGTMAVGEIWVTDSERLALYLRPDELHLGFNFRLLLAGFDAVELRTAIDASLDAAGMAGVPPTWTLSNHRVPLPWEGAEPPFGFSPDGEPWLPMPPEWAKLTVEHQLEDADSTLSLYRQAIELRKTHPAFAGAELEWYGAPAGCFAYRRKGGGLVCVLNGCQTAVPLPAGEILLSSGPLHERRLPPNTAAWLAR